MKKDECHKMARTQEWVRQVIQSINTSKETAIKIGTKNAHEDHMFVTATRMAVEEEFMKSGNSGLKYISNFSQIINSFTKIKT